MKIPSEAELIEMEQRFDFLLEIASILEEESLDFRRRGRIADAEEKAGDAEILESLCQSATELITLVRAGVLGAR